jgi:hypothetical protein
MQKENEICQYELPGHAAESHGSDMPTLRLGELVLDHLNHASLWEIVPGSSLMVAIMRGEGLFWPL